MKSARPKVLHELCGRSMLWYVQQALREAGVDDVLIVTNDELDAQLAGSGARTVVQREQLGTGHAVQIALAQLETNARGSVLVAYADMPLVRAATYRSAIDALDGAALAIVTARMPLPSNFGRVVRDGDRVRKIVEARDATAAQLAIDEMNAGIYAYAEKALRDSVAGLRNDNAQGEYYLTDTIEQIARDGEGVVPVPAADHRDVLGINDRVELALARKHLNAGLCAQHMRDGVTIIDPETTYLEPELLIGRDTVIYPNTSISLLTEVGEGCTVGPNVRLSNAKLGAGTVVRESVIVDAEIGESVTVGPFAHVRGGAKLGDNVRIGNFVEAKNVEMAEGSKASHLSYLGDASIGEESNIGAGTITCNFDGHVKNRTTIGKNVMIGSNSSLVAPITIGDGALTGAGSVVTKDVPPGERVAGNPARPLPAKP
jgi:bifunctional UDP-N-acetylglucosamine pyrophosphorylase/glucosamine-1-phosphate N-acetyltransferase